MNRAAYDRAALSACIVRAAALLRDLGWRVEPPSSKNELAGLVNARRTTMENRLNFSSLPALGQPLEAGIFAGLTTNPDGTHCAVVLLADKPANALAWKPAMTWATELNAELPTRPVAALLFANVDDKFDQSWHWTADELDDSNAWNQFFGYGYQDNASKSFKARARAVRLIQLTP